MWNSECGVQDGEPEGKGRWLDSVGLGLTWLDVAGPSFAKSASEGKLDGTRGRGGRSKSKSKMGR